MSNEQLWVVVRLDEQDRILETFEYDDMDTARESFDEEVQDLGHRAALLPKWLYNYYEQEAQPGEWMPDEDTEPMVYTWMVDDGDHVAAELSVVPASDYEPSLDLGQCCACFEQPATGIAQLPFTAPVPGTGWGCFQCQQPLDGALAVLCDTCGEKLEAGTLPLSGVLWVCNGMVGDQKRILVAGYQPVEFGHNLSQHPELGGVN